MSGVICDASEVYALAADLAVSAGQIEPEEKPVVERTGFQVVGVAQTLAPVDSGALRQSIGVDIDGLEFRAGPTVNYGGFVEDGTEGPYPIENAFGWGITVMHPGISPQPYMGPAFDQALPGFENSVASVAVRVLR